MTYKHHTGGLKEFGYAKPRKLTSEERQGIAEAYEKARKRKLKNRIIKFSIGGLIILAIIFYVLFIRSFGF